MDVKVAKENKTVFSVCIAQLCDKQKKISRFSLLVAEKAFSASLTAGSTVERTGSYSTLAKVTCTSSILRGSCRG